MFLIEPERGCSRGCTYCVMRRTTNGGMRTVAPEKVLSLIPEHARKVGLVGAAVTDHPRIVDLVRNLVESGREVGISSLRAEQLVKKPELVTLLARSGARSITTAADGASERLRTAIDRKTNAQQILGAARLAKAAGMSRFDNCAPPSITQPTELSGMSARIRCPTRAASSKRPARIYACATATNSGTRFDVKSAAASSSLKPLSKSPVAS